MDKQHTGQRSNRDLWRANWTTSLTKTYATLLIEQVIQGNRSNNVFSKKAWKYVRDEFNKQTGHNFDRKQLKNRFDVLKKQYYTMKSLLDRSDFRWDEPRQMVIADDEAWARYIKVHPEAEKIRVNGCPFFQHLRLLFSDSGGDDEVSLGKLQPFTQQVSGPHSQYESEQDQSRAKWTDSLNKIFADLMVEQILQGNRSNATFNKKGWKYIHDEFNRQTGLDFNRKQLKNHHNVLRKLYTTIRSLLDQNGFSWDETECMVIAEDEAWKKYIMTHPEAETIRSKGCPIYKLLCRIFLESGADLESTSSDLETVGHQRENFLTGQDPSSTNWTISLDKIFADLVIEQQLVKFKNIYDQKVWKYICDDFNRQTGLEFNEQQLRDQYSVLRKRYFSVRLLLNQNGFSWDESRCLITAKDEVWDKYLKEHPHFKTLRINGCPIYRQLCRLFSVPGNEEYPQSNHEVEVDKQMDRKEKTWSSECPETGSIYLNSVTPSFCVRDEASSRPREYMNISNGQKKRPLATTSSLGHHKRSHTSTENLTTVGAMTSTSRSRTTVLLAQSGDQFSISNCVKVLNELEGVDEKLYLAALDVFEEPYRRETFISIKSDIRLAWLKTKCKVFLKYHSP